MRITPAAAISIEKVDQMRESSSFIRAFELSVDFSTSEPDEDLYAALGKLRADGVEFTVHAPFRDLNIASLHAAAYQVARTDMMRALKVAERVGATVLNVHPGLHSYYPEADWPRMKQNQAQVYQELSDYGSPRGIRVVAENLIIANNHFEDTWLPDGMIELHDEWDAELKGITLDTGHARQSKLDVADTVLQMGSRIKHLHLQDNHGGMIDEHLPIGTGVIDWDSVIAALDEINFEGYGVFEFGPADAQREAIRFLDERTAAISR
jgi:sugar phosphate isomerase/epimerase